MGRLLFCQPVLASATPKCHCKQGQNPPSHPPKHCHDCQVTVFLHPPTLEIIFEELSHEVTKSHWEGGTELRKKSHIFCSVTKKRKKRKTFFTFGEIISSISRHNARYVGRAQAHVLSATGEYFDLDLDSRHTTRYRRPGGASRRCCLLGKLLQTNRLLAFFPTSIA